MSGSASEQYLCQGGRRDELESGVSNSRGVSMTDRLNWKDFLLMTCKSQKNKE